MRSKQTSAFAFIAPMTLVCLLVLVPLSRATQGQSQENQQAAAGATSKVVGTVKAVSGNAITLATDAGATVSVTILDSTRLVRIAPGQKDLKDAAPIQITDVQVGDRVFARGAVSADGSVAASSVVLMKQAELSAKQEREREDWQKRGIGGLVSTVTVSNQSVVLSTQSANDAKPVTIHISKGTIVRRYSPDSVKFDDAKPGTLDEIKAGDQLRALGVRSADGTELTAEEVVSGSFRNIAGTVISTGAAGNVLNVMDLATKKPVSVKITTDSQLRKLPLPVAQRIATRLRGGSPTDGSGAPGSGGGTSSPAKSGDIAPSSNAATSTNAGARSGGPPDFQQILKRMPTVALADLQKGDAVIIVTTQGTSGSLPTAITLLSGVEPILSASPSSTRAAMLLSPWNLGGGGGADAASGP
jgi:hypothetical protein